MKLSSMLRTGLLLTVFCVGWSSAQSVHPCDPYAPPDRLVAEINYSKWVSDIEVVGDRIYVGANKIDVLEMDAAGVPHVLYEWAVPAKQIVASSGLLDGLLYVTTRAQPYEFIILRPTESNTPEILSRMPMPWGALAVHDNIALVAKQVIDVSDPYQPQVIGSITGTQGETPNDFEWEFPYLHLTTHLEYSIFDFSDPTNPKLVGRAGGPWEKSSVDIQGDHAYVTLNSGGSSDNVGLVIYDISDLTQPVQVGGQSMASEANTVLVDGDRCYVGSTDGTVAVFELETSSRARYVEAQSLGGYSGGVFATKGSFLLVGASRLVSAGRFRVLDMSLPKWRPIEGVDEEREGCVGLAGSEEFLLTLRWREEASIYRLSGESLLHVADADIPEEAWNAVIVGDRAYVAAGLAGLQVVTLSGPDAGSIVGRLNTPASADQVVVQESLAYVADGSGLLIVKVQDPTDLQIVGSYAGSAGYRGRVAIDGTTAYLITDNNNLESVDVSDPKSPRRISISSEGSPPAGKIIVDRGIAYVLSDTESRQTHKLTIFDVRDPSDMRVLAREYVAGMLSDAVLVGDYLYISSRNFGVSIFDVSEPAAPRWIANGPVPYGAYGIVMARERLFFAGYGGLFSGPLHHDGRDVRIEAVRDTISPDVGGTLLGPVARSDDRSLPLSLTPYPNPSRGDTAFSYRVPANSRLSLAIYDASGRIVRTLLAGGTAIGGDGLVRWDGRDQAGKQAASGVYFVRIEAPGVELREKLVMVR